MSNYWSWMRYTRCSITTPTSDQATIFLKELKKVSVVMTLTATLSQVQLESSSADYLKNPVLIKGLINHSKVKLNIKSYIT